jgi:hypothetical protein
MECRRKGEDSRSCFCQRCSDEFWIGQIKVWLTLYRTAAPHERERQARNVIEAACSWAGEAYQEGYQDGQEGLVHWTEDMNRRRVS